MAIVQSLNNEQVVQWRIAGPGFSIEGISEEFVLASWAQFMRGLGFDPRHFAIVSPDGRSRQLSVQDFPKKTAGEILAELLSQKGH